MGSRPSGGGSSQNRLTRQLSARIQVQGERQAVRSLNRVDNAIEGVGSATAGTSSALGSARTSLTGFSQGLESSLGPIDEMFAGQRKLLGVTGDMTNMLMIGGGIASAGLIPTLAGLVGITLDAASGTDELAKSQKRAADAAEALATSIGAQAAFIRLIHSERMSQTEARISAQKDEIAKRRARYHVEKQDLKEEQGRKAVAARTEVAALERIEAARKKMHFSASRMEQQRELARRPLKQSAEKEKKIAETVAAEAAKFKRAQQKLLPLLRTRARLMKEAADSVKADFGAQLAFISKLEGKAKGVLSSSGGTKVKTGAAKEAALIQEQSDAWTRLSEAASGAAQGVQSASEGIVGGLKAVGDGASWIVKATAEMVEFDRITTEAMERGQAMLDMTGQSFAQAAVDAAIFGASAKEAANAVVNQLLRQAAVESLMELGRGFAALASSFWPVFNPLAAASAKAHFAASAGFAALGAGAAVGAIATGGISSGGGISAGGASSAPTDADLPRSQGASGGGGETIIINYNSSGQAIHTADQVGQAITESLDRYSRTRGRSRANLGQLQRRGV